MKIQDRSYWMNPEICIECFKLSKIAADHNESNIPFDGNLQNSRSAGLQYHRFQKGKLSHDRRRFSKKSRWKRCKYCIY